MNNNLKIKYYLAVVICLVATAFSSCAREDEAEIIAIEELNGSSSNMSDEIAQEQLQEVINSTGTSLNDNPSDKNEYIYVYVCGAVANPGVYELAKDSRVVDAILAAGDTLADAAKEYMNLASIVSDGEKVYVPTYEEIEEVLSEGYEYSGNSVNITSKGKLIGSTDDNKNDGGGQYSNEGKTESALVNINTADLNTLMTIPGVGESKANKIIKYREENGGFTCIEDIMLISGIKEGMFNKIKDYICVE